MARVFLSLGSNIGDRLANIQQAVSMLSMSDDVSIVKSSSFYETEPWGNVNQNWFVNAAVALDTNLAPLEFLKLCQSVEKQLGRIRTENKKWLGFSVPRFHDYYQSFRRQVELLNPGTIQYFWYSLGEYRPERREISTLFIHTH